MAISAPPIDARTPADIAEQARGLLCEYLKGEPYHWTPESDGGEVGRALTQVFAHYCGLIIDRLNRAPERNFLAFLELLGNSRVAAQPAEVVITFLVDPFSPSPAMLPARTRVRAEPPAGAQDPIIFETDRALPLTAIQLASFLRADGTGSPQPMGEPLFENGRGYFLHFTSDRERPLPVETPIEMYFWIASTEYDPATWSPSQLEPSALVWEASRNRKSDWTKLLVEDETAGLTRSGSVRFLAPPRPGWYPGDAELKLPAHFYVRLNPPDSVGPTPPRLLAVALNSVRATQSRTLWSEVLGSSNGNPGQGFRTLEKPVLPGPALAVLERRPVPSASETAAWTAWEEVVDFHASGALDRHYTLDHQAGRVRFGDGRQGMIPPLGARNVRMSYQAGGGSAGNVPPGALTTLVAGSKEISKVTNLFAATGGTDAEGNAALLERAPKALRHHQRAVTEEDYEDLAQLATTEVARALCVPIQDLAADPYLFIDTIEEEKAGVGNVSVIIVPRAALGKPRPSSDLLRRVQGYLAERACAGVVVTVVGPLYLNVDISVTVRLQSLSWKSAVERELQTRLSGFLHPLTGNGGAGWPFGRRPHESDLYPVIAQVKGITYVDSLTIGVDADNRAKTPDVLKTRRFLVCSGEHAIAFS